MHKPNTHAVTNHDWLDTLLGDEYSDGVPPHTIKPGSFSLGSLILNSLVSQPLFITNRLVHTKRKKNSPSTQTAADDSLIILKDNDDPRIETEEIIALLKDIARNIMLAIKPVLIAINSFIARSKTRKLSFPKKSFSLALAGALVVVLGGASFLFDGNKQEQARVATGQTLPATLAKQSTQQLYYPSFLPEGYRISTDASVVNETITAYTISKSSNDITVSHQQNIPEEVFLQLFPTADQIDTPNGIAYIESIGDDTTLGGIPIGNTTVFIRSGQPIPSTDMQNMLLSLKKY